jgi:hypothetical protein
MPPNIVACDPSIAENPPAAAGTAGIDSPMCTVADVVSAGRLWTMEPSVNDASPSFWVPIAQTLP